MMNTEHYFLKTSYIYTYMYVYTQLQTGQAVKVVLSCEAK